MRFGLQSFRLTRHNLLGKQVSVPLPELPEHVGISVVSLFDEGLICNFAFDHHSELGYLPLVHPDLPSRVVDHYMTIIITIWHLLLVRTRGSLLPLAQILLCGQKLLVLMFSLDLHGRVGEVGLNRDSREASRTFVRILVLHAQHTLNLMRQRAFFVQRPVESLNQASFACAGWTEEQDVKVVRHILIVIAGSVSGREHLELQDVLSNIVDLLAHDLHHDG